MDNKKSLEQFHSCYVNVVDNDGVKYNHWYVDLFEPYADNNGVEEEGIGIDETKGKNSGVYLFHSEIKSIELAK